jgi:hypothetical protein
MEVNTKLANVVNDLFIKVKIFIYFFFFVLNLRIYFWMK